jgi:hypothetical protein
MTVNVFILVSEWNEGQDMIELDNVEPVNPTSTAVEPLGAAV